MSGHVLYDHIPEDARKILDELYDQAGVEIWWNSPNQLLRTYVRGPEPPGGYLIPRDYPRAAENLANAITDGNFF